jgi:gas vesicle protein
MSNKNKSDNLKKLAIGSGIAAAAGYLAGILSAPKSGKETREDIKDAGDKGRTEAEKDLKKLLGELNDLIKEAKVQGSKAGAKAQVEAKEKLEKAMESKEKVREIISAIHEGDAEDQDLKRAVRNANSAIDHLKDFLKK